MSEEMKINFSDDVWEVIENSKDYFKEELHKEINKNHILHGIEVKEIARREDCDDVLFLLLDGSNRYAVVHLTWKGKKENNPCYPKTKIYDNLLELLNEEEY